MDVVMSTGAIARSGSGAVELVNEVYRMLRPDGLFVFCDSEGSNVIEAIEKVFPATITSGQSAGDKSRKAKISAKRMEESGQKKNKKRKVSGNDIDVAVAIDTVDIVEEANEDDTAVDEEKAIEEPGNVQTRPGISYERISNLFDPYVTGICVRP